MSRQGLAAGIVLFVLAVAAGTFLGSRTSTASEAEAEIVSSTTSTTLPVAVFVARNETVIGPVVIVATTPRLADSQIVIDFDIEGLAPIGDAASVVRYAGFGSTEVVAPQDLDTVFLDTWVLKTGENEIRGSVANPAARAARFEVPDGFDPATIDGVGVVSYGLMTPIDTTISLAPGAETATVAPGISARLLAVTEQDNTIIQVEITSDRGYNFETLSVSGSGPGWLAAVRESEGRPRWNLTFDSATAPSPIELRVSGSIWLTVDEPVVVTTAGSP